jgi:hypothetical protein
MSAVPKSENANKIIIFMVDKKKKNNLINQFVEMVDNKGGIDYEFITSANEVVQYLNMAPQALLMFEIHDRESLAQVISVMKSTEKLIRANHVKVAGFNHIKNDNIEKVLKKMGCSDILTEDIKLKTLSFKIDFWFKTLKSKVTGMTSDDVKKAPGKENKINSEVAVADKKVGLQMVAAIQEENDVWILKHKNDCKNVLRRWLIKLMGPSSQVAKWEQVSVETSTGPKQLWKFDYKPGQAESFSNGEGAWYFDGPKPEFDWKENVWIFSGSNPSLFHSFNGNVEYRFKSEDKAIFFAENSVFAETKKQLIIESFNREYEFKNDEVAAEEAAQSFDGVELDTPESSSHNAAAEAINGKMKGKSETQKLNDEAMSGEGSSADKIDSKLSGKSSKADQIDGQMSGKGGKSDSIDGNLSGAVGPTDQVDSEDDPFEGQVDQLDKYYKGGEGNSAKSETEAEDKKRSGFKDDLGGAMSGQLTPEAKKAAQAKRGNFSSDELDKYYDGESKGSDKKNNDPKRGNFSSDELDKYYDGEASGEKKAGANKDANGQPADKIESYLNGKVSKQEEAPKERTQRTAPQAKAEKDAEARENVIPFAKKKSNSGKDETGDVNDNFSQVYRDGSLPERDFNDDGPYVKKEKLAPRYERGEREELENLDPLTPVDYERLTATGEVKIILEKIGDSQVKVLGQFQDLFARDLVVSVQNVSISVNEKFKVYVLLKYLNQKVSLTIDCIVTMVEEQEDGESFVTLDVQDFSEEKLSHFMEVYMKRQANIGEFLNKVKGNE